MVLGRMSVAWLPILQTQNGIYRFVNWKNVALPIIGR